MAISTKDFTTLVSDQVTAIQGAFNGLVDMTIGSILRSTVETNAGVVIWLESLILQVLATCRAATSTAADLDSWVNDFGVTRIAAVTATGNVTFTRFNTSATGIVPIASKVQSADGTQQYQVIADLSNPAWSVGLNGYTLGIGTGTVIAKVQALTAAAASNAAAGAITTIVGAITGIDRVTNAAQFTTGADAETDAALRARFVNYISNLSKATKSAVGYAVASVQANLKYVLVENQTFSGLAQNGYFYVIVDDGSGSPPASLITSVNLAIDAIRPLCSFFGVFPPLLQSVNVSVTITTAPAYSHSALVALVQTAIINYMNTLTFGQTFPLTQVSFLAYGASPGVINVTGITLNSGTTDITCSFQTEIKPGTVVAI